jgi:hypothetical protein
MTRNQHDRVLDHQGIDLDTNIELNGATTTYTDGEGLHTVIADLDTRVTTVAGSTGGEQDIITGNDSNFASSLGSWTNSGGTMTRDTTSTYKFSNFSASLKFATTAQNQYVELPLAGTFKSGTEYHVLLMIQHESTDTPSGTSWEINFGLIGTDSNTTTQGSGSAGNYSRGYVGLLARWTPTANRTGVKVRFSRPGTETGTINWHIGWAKAINVAPNDGIGLTMVKNPDLTALYPQLISASTFSGMALASGASTSSPAFGVSDRYVFIATSNGTIGSYNDPTISADNVGFIGAAHTPGDMVLNGVNIEAGTDYLGFFIGQKDSSTVQFYADYGDYNFEFVDGATGRWAIRDTSNHIVPLANLITGAIDVVVGGSGSTVSTGVWRDVELPFSGVWTAARLFADQSGSIVVNIWKQTYASFPPTVTDKITASAPPTISSATKSQDTTLTGWTTTFSAGDILRINVDSATTITRATLSLTYRRT